MSNERRHYPRFDVNWPAELRLESGQPIRGNAVNVSPGGIQVACDGRSAAQILPPGSTLVRADAPRTSLRLQICRAEYPAAPAEIEVACRLTHVRRVAQDQYHVGLLFERFAADGERLLDDCLAS